MQDRIWLKHYPPEVVPEIDPDTYASLPDLIHDRAARFSDRPAFSNFGAVINYQRYLELGNTLAAWIQHVLNPGKGERIAIMLPNIMQYPVAVYACLRAGMVVVNINPLYSARELRHQLIDSGATSIIIADFATPVLARIVGETSVKNVITTGLRDLVDEKPLAISVDHRLSGAIEFTRVLQQGAGLTFRPARLEGDDLAVLQYTGGTTGTSKGAMLTHRNLVANTLQNHAYFAPSVRVGEEVYITALPLYHIFALTVNCLACIYCGGLNVLITDPRNMPAFVAELSRHPFTYITGVNTLYNGLLNTPGFFDLDFSTLRTSIAGGMAAQRSVAEKWRQATGCLLLQGYGLSETSPTLAANPLSAAEFTGTIGLPVPSTDLSVRDDEGRPLPPGEPGELCARGPQVMSGYWNRPEETRRVMTDDGFFRTGDMAVCDEQGYFTIVDRKKDMIIVSGFNVFPNEVEDVAASMDGILECACVGTPDQHSGESVVLFVVTRPGAELDAEAVREWCRERLAAYKVPSRVVFVDAIPKSTVGKVLRRALRETLAQAEAR